MSPAETTFETLQAELEAIVRRLEAGELPLAESLALFERATVLAEQCNGLLDQAELRVQQLMVRDDGGLQAEQFEPWQSSGSA